MARAQERRCLNSASSTTATPAASVDLMTAGMLRASLIRIGLAPRPNSMARAIAATPGGPSVSPAGRPGGVPAPVTTKTCWPAFTLSFRSLAASQVSGFFCSLSPVCQYKLSPHPEEAAKRPSRRVGNRHLVCSPCFETLAALAPQHEVFVEGYTSSIQPLSEGV